MHRQQGAALLQRWVVGWVIVEHLMPIATMVQPVDHTPSPSVLNAHPSMIRSGLNLQVGVHEAGMTNTQTFDACVDVGCGVYSKRMHNLICDNCHSHVARCLNEMRCVYVSSLLLPYFASDTVGVS